MAFEESVAGRMTVRKREVLFNGSARQHTRRQIGVCARACV